MPNENGRTGLWLDLAYRTILMAAVIAGGGAAWNNSITAAKIETQITTHLTTHPDVGLAVRINGLERRVRDLELDAARGRVTNP